ncbi:response regulator [Paenibacillus sp. J5C_2022]|uniref:response regulator transcription factor n=1 Tax=Paenibacillus sp. J5C2022 TaxID=2977129 RepID=UPI0021CECB10|nr:response regulator [Paenibacillus sp. J5C2022]MCU6712567.1 response regulator [Paenibacillus sp. J5C2022]
MSYQVLLTEDETAIRQSLSSRINSLDLPLRIAGEAENGICAMKWLDDNYADIVVTDIRMPEMDGLTLVANLKRERPYLICIMISSHDDFEYVQACLDLQVVDYVLKPFKLQKLEEVMRKAIATLQNRRRDDASRRIMNNLMTYRKLQVEFVNMIQLANIGDEIFQQIMYAIEDWADERHELYVPLAEQWLKLTIQSLQETNADLQEEKVIQMCLDDTSDELESDAVLHTTHGDWRECHWQCSIQLLRRGVQVLQALLDDVDHRLHYGVSEQIKSYLNEHYDQKISIHQLANIVGFSRSHLSVLFKQATGMTVWNYLQDIRIDRGKELLLTTNMKNYEIATNIGYENYVHFCKLFKKYTKYNPTEYRKKFQTKHSLKTESGAK